jgi:hypothetical protein
MEPVNFMVMQKVMQNIFNEDAKEHLDKTRDPRKIIFPDGTTIIFQNDSKDELQMIYKKIHHYIDKLDFDSIKRIKKYYTVSLEYNILEMVATPKKDISDNNSKDEDAIEVLKNKLSEKRFSMDQAAYEKIVCDFVRDFLSFEEIMKDNLQIPDNQKHFGRASAEQHALENSLEKGDITEISPHNVPLFGGAAIYKGKNNLLYAGPKVGKSYFSIEVAKHESIKKPLFILLEDYSSDQKIRYESNLSGKEYFLINLEDFDKKYETEKTERMRQADTETFIDISFPGHHHIKVLRKQNYKEMGLVDPKTGKLDKIAIIERIMQEKLDKGIDFICIDPLFAILESGRELTRSHLKRIIEQASKKHMTVLLLHHETKDGKMALTQELRNSFDNIYKLEVVDRPEERLAELKLTEEDARNNAPHVLKIRRTIGEKGTVEHELMSTEITQPSQKEHGPNIESIIREIILSHNEDMLSYETLRDELKKITKKDNLDEKNIKGILKKLKDNENLVDMNDGKTWKNGIKIKPFLKSSGSDNNRLVLKPSKPAYHSL